MKTKIAHITLSMDGGGLENIILKLIKYTNHQQFETSLICLDYGGKLLERLDQSTINCWIMDRQPGLDWKLILKLASLFRRKGFHIIHTHNQAAHFYAGIAAKLARIPILVTTEHSRHNTALSKTRRYEKKFLSLLTDKWVVVSEELNKQATRMDKIHKDKVLTILNGVTLPSPQKNNTPDDNQAFPELIDIPDNHFIICMIARFHPIKNHHLLLDAYVEFKKLHPNASVIFAGDGECKKELESQCKDLDITENVHFLGFLNDISGVLALSNAFVLCSKSEGLPVSLLEACVTETPVLITESANKAGLINSNLTGTVTGNDARDLLSGLQWIYENKSSALSMAKKAKSIVESKYSLDTMIKNYELLYNKLKKSKCPTIKLQS